MPSKLHTRYQYIASDMSGLSNAEGRLGGGGSLLIIVDASLLVDVDEALFLVRPDSLRVHIRCAHIRI